MSKHPELELQVQRMVDGELSRQQIQQLLRSAESQPELWRELAVAFVEDRILAGEARQFARDESLRLTSEDAEFNAGNSLAGPAASLPRNSSVWRNAGLWLSAAAMLMCAAGLGFLVGQGQSRPATPANSNLIAESSPQTAPSNRPVSPAAPYTFQLVDNQGQPIPNAAVPLLTEEAAARLGYNPAQVAIPPALQSEFRRAGYELQPEVKFIEGRMSDGRRVTFPYNDLKIRYYGQ